MKPKRLPCAHRFIRAALTIGGEARVFCCSCRKRLDGPGKNFTVEVEDRGPGLCLLKVKRVEMVNFGPWYTLKIE